MPDDPDSSKSRSGDDSGDDDTGMSATFRVRMYPEQKEKLEEISNRLGVSQGEVFRSLIEDQSLPDRRKMAPPGIHELNREVARIGNNLNQVARVANRYKPNADAVQLMTALVTIERQIESLREQFFDDPPPSPTAQVAGDANGEN